MTTKEERFIEAVECNGLEKVKDYIDQGVSVNYGNDFALRQAVNFGYLDIVKLLLKRGANPRVYDDMIMYQAARYGRLEIIKCLITYGIDVKSNKEVLLLAKENNHQTLVDFLENYELKESNLKALNTDGRKVCAKCSGFLRMPVGMGNTYNYCPACEG